MKQSLWAETRGAPRTLFLLLTFGYFFGTELVWAQTLGKRVMKLRVVGEDGAKLSAGAAAMRRPVTSPIRGTLSGRALRRRATGRAAIARAAARRGWHVPRGPTTLGTQTKQPRRLALRGKSGHHRAGWSGTPTRGNPRESATETHRRWRAGRIPPSAHRQG